MKRGELVLADGSRYPGYSFGYPHSSTGEVVFTTGMVGYPESLTDPSFRGQILVTTYPLIGNYGVPGDEQQHKILKNFESNQIQVRGMLVQDYSDNHNHWNSTRSLGQWLEEQCIPALYGIDTRAVTKKLRAHGVMLGKIVIGEDIQLEDPTTKNLVAEVSCKERLVYTHGEKRILLIDCGVKNNIIHHFIKRKITIIRVPWDYDFSQEEYDGIFISNGPGDPKQCTATIIHLQKALQQSKPIFGICLGSQLLALAAGADTYKLKFGHRGQNQPCHELGTRRCFITSQNHGYAVDEETLPEEWLPWFRNINDGSNEGIKHISKPFMAVQFHPEAHPGPEDTESLFDRFVNQL
jgi:carbamoyl-phosphate synthase small subunit